MTVKAEWVAQMRTWRKAQDSFYSAILNETELYMVGLELVRALVDSLSHITELDELVAYYQTVDEQYVVTVANTLSSPLLFFLEYGMALGAAFFIRAQEIEETQAVAVMSQRIAEAQQQNEAWVTLYDEQMKRNGVVFYQRLEMKLEDGLGFRTASELDWEKGRVFVLEPLLLDRENGRVRRDVPLPDKKQEFMNESEFTAAIKHLQQKLTDSEVLYGAA